MKFKEVGFKAKVELPGFNREAYLKITTAEHGTTAYVREDVVHYLMDLVVISRMPTKFTGIDPDGYDRKLINEYWQDLGKELNEIVEGEK